MKINEWFTVENLQKQQQEQNSRYNNSEYRDIGNDFVSYRMLFEGYGYEECGILNHNLSTADAQLVAKEIIRLQNKYMKKNKMSYHVSNYPKNVSVGDFGGGAGFLASALVDYYPIVYSYDVSEYAGKYGRDHFPRVSFVTKGIEKMDLLKEGPFDIVIAYEFYPFTRTDEWRYGQEYIETCFENLKDNGLLIIGLPVGKKLIIFQKTGRL